ncbi:hypothetical protein BDP27DRAFT_1427596 [Rhodocollybia butyracea]|uniref:F-box domain-containing protein n=1 Tax=Rhodocollybia butyracea TaxID=206335 RepID=A0A9P5U1C9_9AGAR|nr:hypothetical protein BDP27DRAFT_1427596 [Rhodocollybia butyracea]
MLNYDIITVICAEISDRHDDRHLVPKDLLSLGLVSKRILEPALDGMWKRINSLQPLLSVLPEATLVNGKKQFLQPMSPSWDRLRFYTSRVREFGGDAYVGNRLDVHDSVYAYLDQGKPIFPRLKMLHLTPPLCSPNSFALFLGTGLQVVSWPDSTWGWPEADPDSDLGPSLALLVSKNPGLKSLTLGQYPFSELSLSLGHLCTLKILEVNHLVRPEMGFIRAIALLPNLTDLCLTLPTMFLFDYAGVENGFPSLTKFFLRGSTFDTRKILAVMRTKILRDLSIDWHVENQSFLADIVVIIRFLPSIPSLWSLQIEGAALHFLLADINAQLLWSIFEPLLELKRLELLAYNVPLPLSDQNTVTLACAWPHLKCFHLYSADESLAHFAQHCPNLEILSYPIQLQTTTPSIMIPPTLSPHPLHTFETQVEGDFDVIHAPAIALYLYQTFPNLVHARGSGVGWRLVQKILDSFIIL